MSFDERAAAYRRKVSARVAAALGIPANDTPPQAPKQETPRTETASSSTPKPRSLIP